jgi:ABC-type antimicrobial peptide transport system permease subunit
VFAAVALLIASTGFYAAVAQSVSQRTQELALRLAIGAGARDILRLVLREGMIAVAIGLGIGLLGAVAVNRLFETQLVRISPSDPLTFAGTSALLIACGVVASVMPARRAIRTDPIVALKVE